MSCSTQPLWRTNVRWRKCQSHVATSHNRWQRKLHRAVRLIFLIHIIGNVALAADFVVTNAGDIGPGTLRQAIVDANTLPGPDVISFNNGSGAFTILPASALPVLTESVTIDATTQPGFGGTPVVEITGTNAGAGVSGLRVFASSCVVRGLVINRFAGNGIVIATNGFNTVEGCYIGTGLAGTNDMGNTLNGIAITNSANNVIGSLTAVRRNVICGNNQHGLHITGVTSTNNEVLGNIIGLGVNSADLGNTVNGIFINGAPRNIIGGATPGARNIISGNNSDGVEISLAGATLNTIRGNFIGTDPTGMLDRGNTGDGIHIGSAPNNFVGGTNDGERNIISGNNADGVDISATASNRVVGNFIGTDVTGIGALANSLNGINLNGNARTNFIGGIASGEANRIAFNGADGINIGTGANTNNVLRANKILANVGLGIDLLPNGVTLNDAGDSDAGPNMLQNFPVLAAATNSLTNTVIVGTLFSRSNTTYTIDFYSNNRCDASGHGEGETYLGATNVTTDASGAMNFLADLPAPAAGLFITATATDPFGNTSEFSQCQRSVSLIPEQEFTVTNTNDIGPGSLRQALLDSDQFAGSNNVVRFDIPGTGVQTIRLLTPLAILAEKITIDGYSQPGADCNTLSQGDNAVLLIRIDGGALGANARGLQFFGGDNVVRGLVLGHFPNNAIEFTNGGNNVVEGCFIGIDADGSTLFTNRGSGIRLNNSANNRIGGTTPCARNVISGNGISTGGNGVEIAGYGSTNNVVQGCYIGTDADGSLPRGNSPNGIRISLGTYNVIGGTVPGAGNVISGNNHPTAVYSGVRIQGVNSGSGASSNNAVHGNIIGLDRTGSAALGNGDGIFIEFAPSNMIGGPIIAARNIVSGNRLDGIEVSDADQGMFNVVQGNFIGLDANGAVAISNGVYGVEIATRQVLIGGVTAVPGLPPGNVISGNGSGSGSPAGIFLALDNNRVEGNLIGTDASGTLPLGNYGDAIRTANGSGNTIGGPALGAGNIIAATRRVSGGQASGINFGASTNNRVLGNWIGTDISGTRALGNERHGIYIASLASAPNLSTVIGGAAPNVIAFNGSNGVHYASPAQGTSNVMIRGNSFYRNGGLAIELTSSGMPLGVTRNDVGDADRGANMLQNFPLISSAIATNDNTVVEGVLNSTSNSTFTLDFYASPECDPSGNGEGQFYLGALPVTTDAEGNATFSITLPPIAPGFVVTATATHPTEGTSEFSPCEAVAESTFPRLTIHAVPQEGAAAQFQLRWLSYIGGWSIETTTNLSPPAVWTPVPNPFIIDDGTFKTFLWTNANSEPMRWFRLVFATVYETNAPLFVTRGPYLQIGTPRNMTVRWRSNRPIVGRITYGTNANDLNQSVDDLAQTQEHEAVLPNLQPNTRYYYAVGTSQTNLVRSTNLFFWTSPLTNKPTRIWAIGDAGTVNLGNPGQAAVRNAFNAFNTNRYVDVWLMLGDNAYNTGTDAQYQAAVFNMYTNLLPQTPVWPALGNHETAQSHSQVPTTPYLSIFSLPRNGEAGGVPSGTERFYSFDYGNIHFVCLDSMTSLRTTNGPMANWLRADLEANTNFWLIAFFHHPPYTKGSHDSDDPNGNDFELVQMRENIVPILESHGADLVLSGHSHCYERSYLMKGHYGSSTNLQPSMILNNGGGGSTNGGPYVKTSEGTVYIVDGSSGQATFVQPDWPHPIMYQPLLELGSLILDIDGNQLVAQFLRENGQVQDTFTLIKQAPGAPLVSRR